MRITCTFFYCNRTDVWIHCHSWERKKTRVILQFALFDNLQFGLTGAWCNLVTVIVDKSTQNRPHEAAGMGFCLCRDPRKRRRKNPVKGKGSGTHATHISPVSPRCNPAAERRSPPVNKHNRLHNRAAQIRRRWWLASSWNTYATKVGYLLGFQRGWLRDAFAKGNRRGVPVWHVAMKKNNSQRRPRVVAMPVGRGRTRHERSREGGRTCLLRTNVRSQRR